VERGGRAGSFLAKEFETEFKRDAIDPAAQAKRGDIDEAGAALDREHKSEDLLVAAGNAHRIGHAAIEAVRIGDRRAEGMKLREAGLGLLFKLVEMILVILILN
jgi:hypothetical protein